MKHPLHFIFGLMQIMCNALLAWWMQKTNAFKPTLPVEIVRFLCGIHALSWTCHIVVKYAMFKGLKNHHNLLSLDFATKHTYIEKTFEVLHVFVGKEEMNNGQRNILFLLDDPEFNSSFHYSILQTKFFISIVLFVMHKVIAVISKAISSNFWPIEWRFTAKSNFHALLHFSHLIGLSFKLKWWSIAPFCGHPNVTTVH